MKKQFVYVKMQNLQKIFKVKCKILGFCSLKGLLRVIYEFGLIYVLR